jgi:hypothetical protein
MSTRIVSEILSVLADHERLMTFKWFALQKAFSEAFKVLKKAF